MYPNNHFHNFDHASHVAMSVSKLMARIASDPSQGPMCGIVSDPLTQFTCVFSALIHDVGHPGVPNTQLMLENPQLAAFYHGRSIAEQNSLDLAWGLLMDTQFSHLRHAIYQTDQERCLFRQLLVNSVMATDIMDKELKELRNMRWDKAFNENACETFLEPPNDALNRKATVVIEHLIQASDVAHTMQHWQVYNKWNCRLFQEMHQAYRQGRAATNPGDFWYQAEMEFFDSYIIPLAKKLKDCGVFGVSGDEFLNFAVKNRLEWEQRGQELVAHMKLEAAALWDGAA
jgi:hypothetical protein